MSQRNNKNLSQDVDVQSLQSVDFSKRLIVRVFFMKIKLLNNDLMAGIRSLVLRKVCCVHYYSLLT